jgi:hypothetical protein
MPYSQYTGNAVSLLLLVSPLGLLMWALRARQLRRRFEHPSVVALVEVVVVLNAVGVLAITLLSPGGNGQPVDLNPLSGDIQSAASRAQLIGNALLFAPLGLLGGLRFTALPRGAVRVLGPIALVGVVETAQYVLSAGRVASAQDVLVGAAGLAVGYRLGTFVARARPVRHVLRATTAPESLLPPEPFIR